MKFKNLLWGMALAMFFTSCGSSEETTENTETTETTEQTDETAPEGITGSYVVNNEESSIAWVGYQKLQDKQHNGTITLSEGAITLENGTLTEGSFVVDMTSIANLDLAESPEMKGKLEGHLKSPDFFDVENYPTATFEATSAKGSVVVGNLTVRGKTEEVEVKDVSFEETEDGITASGKLTFDRSKFDVKYGSGSFFEDLGDNVIDNNIELTITLVATAAE